MNTNADSAKCCVPQHLPVGEAYARRERQKDLNKPARRLRRRRHSDVDRRLVRALKLVGQFAADYLRMEKAVRPTDASEILNLVATVMERLTQARDQLNFSDQLPSANSSPPS